MPNSEDFQGKSRTFFKIYILVHDCIWIVGCIQCVWFGYVVKGFIKTTLRNKSQCDLIIAFYTEKKRNNIGLLLCTCICCGCWYVFACHIVKLQLYALDVDLYIWRQGWQHDRSFSGLHVSSVVDDFWYSGHSTPVQHDSSSVQVNHPRWHPQQTGGQRKRVSHSWQFCWLAPLNWMYI